MTTRVEITLSTDGWWLRLGVRTAGPLGGMDACCAYLIGLVGAEYIRHSSAQNGDTLASAFQNTRRMKVWAEIEERNHPTLPKPMPLVKALIITFDDSDYERLEADGVWRKVGVPNVTANGKREDEGRPRHP
jgi:hypothetical protein